MDVFAESRDACEAGGLHVFANQADHFGDAVLDRPLPPTRASQQLVDILRILGDDLLGDIVRQCDEPLVLDDRGDSQRISRIAPILGRVIDDCADAPLGGFVRPCVDRTCGSLSKKSDGLFHIAAASVRAALQSIIGMSVRSRKRFDVGGGNLHVIVF